MMVSISLISPNTHPLLAQLGGHNWHKQIFIIWFVHHLSPCKPMVDRNHMFLSRVSYLILYSNKSYYQGISYVPGIFLLTMLLPDIRGKDIRSSPYTSYFFPIYPVSPIFHITILPLPKPDLHPWYNTFLLILSTWSGVTFSQCLNTPCRYHSPLHWLCTVRSVVQS